MTENLGSAVACLQQGNILAYPTEAVWGLGCDPYQRTAFEKLLQLKQRPIEKGVILLASDIEQIEFLLEPLSQQRRAVVLSSWQSSAHQQATTWLFPTHSHIPIWITGQHQRVAVRLTQHPLCQSLCRAFGGFIVSTSANPAQCSPAINYQQAFDYFQHHVEYLQGEIGGATRPSRIVDACTGQILRP